MAAANRFISFSGLELYYKETGESSKGFGRKRKPLENNRKSKHMSEAKKPPLLTEAVLTIVICSKETTEVPRTGIEPVIHP